MKILFYIAAMLFITLNSACKKNFLDAKPSTSIVAPSTLNDLQLLLENTEMLNSGTPGLPIMGADEYVFIDYTSWQSAQSLTERNSYLWTKDIFQGETDIRDWNQGYSAIFYCNNILEALNKIEKSKTDINFYNTIKGWALFVRAYALYDLVTSFSPAYDMSTSSTDLGVPIRLKPGIDEILSRSTVKETYNQILSDLNLSSSLLGATMPENRNRPSRPAAYALFSRIYLSMRDYSMAEKYADSSLTLYSKLIDYNTISITSTTPFPINCDEVIYTNGVVQNAYPVLTPYSGNTRVTVNPELIKIYDPLDLRLNIFFKKNATTGNLFFNRSYYPHIRAFTGLATDELYLIKAECLVRRNQLSQAVIWLNSLLIKRFSPANYKPVIVPATDGQFILLNRVLLERRKELVWCALRGTDLKRRNKEGANITLTRTLNGNSYELLPNDPRYVFPIPDDEIALSGIQQNIR